MKKDNPTFDAKATFHKWWAKYRGFDGEPGSEAVWQYFHREFPREAMEIVLSEMLDHIECDKKEIPEVRWASVIGNALHKCKRLWNGGEVDALASNLLIPAGMICDTCGQLECICKSKCPTCGGSKRVASHNWTKCTVGCSFNSHWKPCPDCKPTCPTCEGSGEKCTLLSDLHKLKNSCDIQPCSDCKEQFTFLRQDGLKYPNERKIEPIEKVMILGDKGKSIKGFIERHLGEEIAFVCTDRRKRNDKEPKEPMFTRGDLDKHIVYDDERKGHRRVRSVETVIIIGNTSIGKDNYIARNTDGEIRHVCIGQREKDRRIKNQRN